MTPLLQIIDIMRGCRVTALTGAGLSTDSGIPDYRGAGTRARTRTPIQFQNFVSCAVHRQRYWARSTLGWPKIRDSHPNEGHKALVALEEAGALVGTITQNVDRLHHRAAAQRVVELHGALAEVRCLGCGAISSRDALQKRLMALNPEAASRTAPAAPDGDADLEDPRIQAFLVPNCEACEGILKPNVVFFGESVPAAVVKAAWSLYEESEVLLVLGSSLAVYSGYRFVRRATADGKPVLIITMGESRGDEEATVTWNEPLGTALPAILSALV